MILFGNVNTIRLAADLTHLQAILFLIVSILWKKSCEGISGKTQILYAIVFTSRYSDLIFTNISVYNTTLKVAFLFLTFLTLLLIYWKFRNKGNQEHDTFKAELLVISTFGLAFFINYEFSKFEIAWTFSQYLEAVAIVPQIYMSWKSGQSVNCVASYIRLLAYYKLLYISNWVYRYYTEYFYDQISAVSGSTQFIILCIGIWLTLKRKEKTQVMPSLKMSLVAPGRPVFHSDVKPQLDHQEQKVTPTTVVSTLPETDQMLDAGDKTPLFCPN